MAAHPRDQQPRDVVVVGASLAGAFAAAAASGGDRSVLLVERDPLPAGPQPRPGVPQGRQPHVFLHRGLQAMEELLPGLRADLLTAGAVPFNTGELAWLGEFGWLPPHEGYEVLSATRPLIEHVVLRRVRDLGVQVRDGHTVRSLRRAPGGRRWLVELPDGTAYPADLVVDASGRSSRLPVWLAAAGVPPAPVTEVDARIGYATRTYRCESAPLPVPGIVVFQVPQTMTGGLALRVEGNQWLVGAVGAGERRPPRDSAGFRRFLAGLRDPALADLERVLVPVGEVAVHRQTGNRRHHYEQVSGWPDGLLVVGDALCAFNPVYGQGITVAACQALLLRRALVRGLSPAGVRQLLREVASSVELPWAIATGEDLRYPSSSGRQGLGQTLLGRWTRELGRLSVHGNLRAQETTAGVYHLVESPLALLHPALLVQAAAARARGSRPAAPRPDALQALAATGR